MRRFIEDVADLFDPLADFARVGYHCEFDDRRWILGLYLGRTEQIGGKDDGKSCFHDFRFDLQGLLARFSSVERCHVSALSRGEHDTYAPVATLTVEGTVDEFDVRVHVYSVPPVDAGPGLFQHVDGRTEPA